MTAAALACPFPCPEYPRVAEHEPTTITTLIATLLGGGVVGSIVTAVAQAFRKPSAPAEMVDAATAAARAMFDTLERRVGHLELENERCRTENGRLWDWGHSLEGLLRDNGINIPARELPGAFVVIEGTNTTVLKPEGEKAKP